MKIFKLAILLCIGTILIHSCSKDPVEAADDNTISTAPAVNKCDYSPYSPGTSFTFELASKGFFDEKWTYVEQRGKMTGYQDINGKKYTAGVGFFAQDTTAKQSEGFIRCDGTGMFVLAKGLNNGKDMELPMLQYPLTKGKTWKSTAIVQSQQGVSTNQQYHYKVLNTGLTKKIKNNTFSDVVEIEEKIVSTITFGTDVDVIEYSYKRYYDKKVGIIQSIFFNEDPFSGAVDTALVQNIVSYSIK